MNAQFLVAVLAGFAILFGFFALIRSGIAGREADQVHKRLNGFFAKVDADKITKLYTEVFRPNGYGYPDLGLRQWCREWRQKLRDAVRSLDSRTRTLEQHVSALEVENYGLKSEVAILTNDLGLLYQHLGLRVNITPEKVIVEPEKIEVVKVEVADPAVAAAVEAARA